MKRILWLITIAVGVGLAYFLAHKPARPVILATATTKPSPATTQPAIIPVHHIETYGQLLHADLHHYPETRPWAVPVDLPDAAHVILHEPVYVCSRGDLWITRGDADPLPQVLARAAGESEHLIDRQVAYIIWSPNRRGAWEASAICPTAGGFELVSANATQPIPWHRSYRWNMAMTWFDGSTTRLIVPTDDGVSIITIGDSLSEDFCPLLSGHAAGTPPPRVLFDLRGLLAWIPADGDSSASTRVARYLDSKWTYLDSSLWPANIIHLVPMLDGSVLQIRRGSEPGSVQLTIVPLDSPNIDENEIESLTEQLGDDDPDKRAAAYERLTQYGPGIYPILQKLSPNASPEAQNRIRQILEGRLATKLGGMPINDNQLSVRARLPDGGVVFSAPHGVAIPREDQDPQIVNPDFLAVRPGQPVRELPPAIVAELSKPGTTISAYRDEWIVTSPDAGPQRFLPPNRLDPLLRPSELSFSRFLAIDGRGRWIFCDDAYHRTLILDPTVPDPTPRLAIWLINAGDAGWTKSNWPALERGNTKWIVNDHDFQPLDSSEQILAPTPPGEIPPVTTMPSLMTDTTGNRYYDGRFDLIVTPPKGKTMTWPLPVSCAGSADEPAFMAGDRQGHLFLFNSEGRIARLTATPLAPEAVFGQGVPDLGDISRVWCDPAGRIDVVYGGRSLAIIFPTGQIPPEIEDKILPQDLRRIDAR